MPETDPITRIAAAGCVAILRRLPAGDLARRVDTLVSAGIDVVEITLDSDGACNGIREAALRGDACILAGTVRTAEDAERAIEAGAHACVGPALAPEAHARCRAIGVPFVPGALTPSEIESAWRAGAPLVKLFPASLGGPGYLRALRGPLADVPLMATGGIGPDEAAGYLHAGATAVGCGGALAAADEERAAAAARALVAAVAAARGDTPGR